MASTIIGAKGEMLMRLTINIDVTPQEARTFFGMPDVEPLNAMVVAEMTRRAKDQKDTLADPERMVAQWVQMSGKGMDALSGLFGAAMSGAGMSGMGMSGTGGAAAPKKK
jgi:hypothetical protein